MDELQRAMASLEEAEAALVASGQSVNADGGSSSDSSSEGGERSSTAAGAAALDAYVLAQAAYEAAGGPTGETHCRSAERAWVSCKRTRTTNLNNNELIGSLQLQESLCKLLKRVRSFNVAAIFVPLTTCLDSPRRKPGNRAVNSVGGGKCGLP